MNNEQDIQMCIRDRFGCGKKEPVEDVEPQDTTEQLDENIKNDISGTYAVSYTHLILRI